MPDLSHYMHHCLFFTANSLARAIGRLAEEEFGKIGFSPSQGFLLMLAVDQPGISQKHLAVKLALTQSTVSRLVGSLVARNLIRKESEGKHTRIFPTKAGEALLSAVQAAWHGLYERYTDLLGKEFGDRLAQQADEAALRLNPPEDETDED